MALGGGTFLAQNKILPGAYMNFVSAANASTAISDRGVATLPLALNWGPEGSVITMDIGEFHKNSQSVLGYTYTDSELRPIRELFRHSQKLHLFRLNTSGTKASCTYATAKYPGTRGNDLRIVIEAHAYQAEEVVKYDVSTFLGTILVDRQNGVANMSELQPNAYVDFNQGASIALTANTPLTHGSNGEVDKGAYQAYLDQMEAYSFNAMGCLSTDEDITAMFVSYCKRMRDEVGKKFQLVCFRTRADYEGVVSVKNGLVNPSSARSVADVAVVGKSKLGIVDGEESSALVPWVTGVVAGTGVNRSASNQEYDGEYSIFTAYSQADLERGIKEGSFMFHKVDDAVVVLEDINTFVSVTDEKSSDFSSNQTVRVLDQIANDVAVLFGKKYIGKVPNDDSGRISLWNDIVKHHQWLQTIRAIENFSPDHVTVAQGDTKKAVVVTDYVTPVNAMAQLYMTVYVQ